MSCYHGIRDCRVSVCLSVCPSRHSTEAAKCTITQTMRHDSPVTHFVLPKISAKLKRGDPQRRHQMQVG